MEAGCICIFMIAACSFRVLLEHPMSPVHQSIDSASLRRAIAGVALGLTSIALICSPWGKRSGAHLNPALTLTFLWLGKIKSRDAVFYVAAQFLGAIAGIQAADLLIGLPLRHGAVNYAATVPGSGYSIAAAFAAEFAISMLMMLMVLLISNNRRISRFTPYVAGTMVALYVWIEAPVSGMSMNPARTFGSATGAGDWNGLWIYFTAPLLGMMAAGRLYTQTFGIGSILCAKLHHHNRARCIFDCNFVRASGNKGAAS